MSANALLQRARKAGMIVTRDGGQLRVIRPKSEATDAILAELKTHKAAVLLSLCGDHHDHDGCQFATGSLYCVKADCGNPHHRDKP